MPHLMMSVSPDLAEHKHVLLQAAHQAMLDSVLTVNQDIKSRVMVCEEVMVGEHNTEAFVHVEVRLLRKAERTNAAQKTLADAITAALNRVLPKQSMTVQLSCDMVLMNDETYSKIRVEA